MPTEADTRVRTSPTDQGDGRPTAFGALDPRLYFDPAVAEIEQRAIFERTWQLAGHISDLSGPGSWITASAGNQSVVVARDKQGGLQAFRNVCRHRGRQLLGERSGCSRAIRCAYHGWTYALDGSLLGAPEIRGFSGGLDRAAHGLLPVRVEELCGLLFVNLDPGAAPLRELVDDLPARLGPYEIPSLVRAKAGDAHTQAANWKVVADNYLEGYHVPIAHPSLMRLLDYERYRPQVRDHYVWFEAPMRPHPSENRAERLYQRLVRPMGALTDEDRRVWRYLFIYPNTAIDLYPDQVGIWQISPDGPERTRDTWAMLRPRREGLRDRAIRAVNDRVNDVVNHEDVELVEAVQRGLHTTGYRCGPLNAREAGVGWLADRVRGDLGAYGEAPA
ncbi:MAG TPA: aromatic ring-hydroxylating dioxygenase subunit alpha [Solirubrobacterales bacterium]|nr:aromatic ring-hydroxylating dioxygenase subunit alpha [Solirubrobacterales bacterium]